MNITDVKVLLRGEAKLKAYAAVTFENCFVVRDIRIIQGSNRLFIAMPSRRRPDGRHKDVAHPLDTDTRRMIEEKILEAYQLASATASVPDAPVETPAPAEEAVEEVPQDELTQSIDEAIDSKFNR